MNKIVEFLRENNIEFKEVKYGDNYFGDDFQVPGLLVSFDIYTDPEASTKIKAFECFMKRKKSYAFTCWRWGCGWAYRIMTVFDDYRYMEHEAKKKLAVDAFWQAEHKRRMKQAALG